MQENVVKVALGIFATWSENVHRVWFDVFVGSLREISIEMVKKHCVSAVIRLGEFSQAVTTRILATRLIGTLAEKMKEEFKGEILQKALMMAQDTRFEIRKSMCGEMTKICRAVGNQYRNRVIDEVLQLANDEELEVKSEALALLIEIFDLLPTDCIQDHALPLIRSSLFDPYETIIKEKLNQIIGLIIVKVWEQIQDEEFLNLYLAYFQSLATSGSEIDRKIAAFQFPGVISALGETLFSEHLNEYYELLTRDESIEVRMVIAGSFHEVVKLLPEESAAMCDIFGKLLGEKKLLNMLLGHFSDILPCITADLFPGQTLSQFVSILCSSLPWRQADSLLTQIHTSLALFPIYDIIDILQPALLSLYPKAHLPVKYTIIKMFASVIHINFLSDKRHELCTSILLLLSKSRHYQDRILFVDFCVRILELNSRKFFQQFFYAVLIRMTQDSVSNVRLKIARHFATFYGIFYADEEMHTGLSSALSRFLTDSDPEIVSLAQAVHNSAQKPDYWLSIQHLEIEDQDKTAHEDLQTEQEARVTLTQEREEAKKRLVQELTEKARMDYLQQYKDKKHAVGKPSKTGLLKSSATSARLPYNKGKTEGAKPHSSSANTSPKLSPISPVLRQIPAKPLVSRKK